MNYNADGNTGYYIDEPGIGWKYAHGNTGHHFEPGGGGHNEITPPKYL
ncbi:hypothetical protein [Bacillus mycoides]|nr:hypothetical protein [Bacillus mycoides]